MGAVSARPSSLLPDIIEEIGRRHPDTIATISVPTGEEVAYEHVTWLDGREEIVSRAEFEQILAYCRGLQYRDARANAYPPLEEQLDMIYHGGIEAWRETIAAVKEQYPKPSGL